MSSGGRGGGEIHNKKKKKGEKWVGRISNENLRIQSRQNFLTACWIKSKCSSLYP